MRRRLGDPIPNVSQRHSMGYEYATSRSGTVATISSFGQ